MGAIALIEVIIGLTFVVLLTSIIVSLVNEIIVTNLKIRSKLLKKAIIRMLDDSSHSEVLGNNFYNHPLIKKLTKNKKVLPSYISSSTFSKVLVDVLNGYDERTDDIKVTIEKLPEKSETRAALLALLNDAGNNVDKFKDNVGQWFDESMDRLSGWYKRYTQLQLFIIGFFVAMILNVDIIHIAKELSDDKDKRMQIAEAARDYVKSKKEEVFKEKREIQKIIVRPSVDAGDSLPSPAPPALSVSNTEMQLSRYDSRMNAIDEEIDEIKSTFSPLSGLVGIFWNGKVRTPKALVVAVAHSPISAYLGWLITALAASLGSAFWFDMLKKLINIRGSSKPESKK